jgi:uncharacterized membrane protein YgaE (UPF0421/DUF939 family)
MTEIVFTPPEVTQLSFYDIAWVFLVTSLVALALTMLIERFKVAETLSSVAAVVFALGCVGLGWMLAGQVSEEGALTGAIVGGIAGVLGPALFAKRLKELATRFFPPKKR